MTLADDIRHLSRVSLFEPFSVEQLRLLAFGAKRIIFRAGETLFQQGRMSDGGYVVLSGEIELTVGGDDEESSHQTTLASCTEGSLIGELSLITANRRIATATARTNAETLFIPRELFRRMLAEYPELAADLSQQIMANVRTMLKEMGRVRGRMVDIPDLSESQGSELSEFEPGDDGDMI